ncbi:MAG: response regulator transcription factor [Cyclobacteriaceae bacterium]|nr:response regulator transcription factor [Cyclobacteriaceae bacterium]
MSDREKEIILLTCKELTIREIADKLSLSENTVRNHRINIMEKLGVGNVIGLVRHAYESGLIS